MEQPPSMEIITINERPFLPTMYIHMEIAGSASRLILPSTEYDPAPSHIVSHSPRGGSLPSYGSPAFASHTFHGMKGPRLEIDNASLSHVSSPTPCPPRLTAPPIRSPIRRCTYSGLFSAYQKYTMDPDPFGSHRIHTRRDSQMHARTFVL